MSLASSSESLPNPEIAEPDDSSPAGELVCSEIAEMEGNSSSAAQSSRPSASPPCPTCSWSYPCLCFLSHLRQSLASTDPVQCLGRNHEDGQAMSFESSSLGLPKHLPLETPELHKLLESDDELPQPASVPQQVRSPGLLPPPSATSVGPPISVDSDSDVPSESSLYLPNYGLPVASNFTGISWDNPVFHSDDDTMDTHDIYVHPPCLLQRPSLGFQLEPKIADVSDDEVETRVPPPCLDEPVCSEQTSLPFDHEKDAGVAYAPPCAESDMDLEPARCSRDVVRLMCDRLSQVKLSNSADTVEAPQSILAEFQSLLSTGWRPSWWPYRRTLQEQGGLKGLERFLPEELSDDDSNGAACGETHIDSDSDLGVTDVFLEHEGEVPQSGTDTQAGGLEVLSGQFDLFIGDRLCVDCICSFVCFICRLVSLSSAWKRFWIHWQVVREAEDIASAAAAVEDSTLPMNFDTVQDCWCTVFLTTYIVAFLFFVAISGYTSHAE